MSQTQVAAATPPEDAAAAGSLATTGRHAGISIALRIDVGLSVLLVGAADGILGEAIAGAGAEVIALEADDVTARAAGARLVHLESAHVIGSTLSAWTESADPAAAAFDLIVFTESRPDTRPTATLDEFLGVADSYLRRSGSVIIAVHNRWALSSQLRGARAGGGHSPSALGRVLREHGLQQQRWLLAYPDHHRPQALVDVRLFDDAAGRSVIRSSVRDPVPDVAPEGDPYLVTPRQAFEAALDAGLAPGVAEGAIVIAAYDAQALADVTRAGLLWTGPDQDLGSPWQRPRELLELAGRRLWHPPDSYRSHASGPIILDSATYPATVGQNAEDSLVDALTGPGARSDKSRGVLGMWWRAASLAIDTAEPGRRHLDLRPRHFTLTEDGEWSYQPQDLRLRFSLAREALAFGALTRTIREAVLPQGWLVGLRPDATIGEAARVLCTDAGVAATDAHAYLWVETSADVMVRTTAITSRAEARRVVETQLGARLDSRMASLPVETLLKAGARLPEVSAVAASLAAELATARSQLRALQGQIEP